MAGSIAYVASRSTAQEWRPLPLFGLLVALAFASERFEFSLRGQHLSAGLIALVLTMTLLGPAPAVAFGLVVTVSRRPSGPIPFVYGWATCPASPSFR